MRHRGESVVGEGDRLELPVRGVLLDPLTVFAARELDPFSLIINTNVGWVLSMAGRYDEAISYNFV